MNIKPMVIPSPQFHGVMLDANCLLPTLVNVTTGKEGDERKPMMIYDLDNTLADDSKRRKYLTGPDQKDFDAYMKGIPDDEPNWPVIEQLVRDHQNGAVIVIITGRNDDYLTKTLRQLHKFQIAGFVSSLLMRPYGDFRSAEEYKRDAIGLLVEEGSVIAGIVDDDERVRKMAGELGIENIDPADIIQKAKDKEHAGLILPPGV